ncbi:MAG: hypothetical protein JO295_02260, partial [Verrucomicrobia bacterium]|nr:hypothetical protein [Verrucomicrobiota bacterium]
RAVCTEQEIIAGKTLCEQIVEGLIRLIQTLSPTRIHEGALSYQAPPLTAAAPANSPSYQGMPLEWDEPVEE